MLERHFAPILRGVGKHLHKNLLRQIFLVEPPGQMRPDDFDDQGIQMLDQRAGGVLITLMHTRQAHRDIQAGLLTHRQSANLTSTGLVTTDSVGGYNAGRNGKGETNPPVVREWQCMERFPFHGLPSTKSGLASPPARFGRNSIA